MSIVDPEFAAWLGSEELLAVAVNAAAEATWGTLAIDTRISSALAFKGDADAEAARQINFRPGPLVIETLSVPGQQIGLIGKVVTLRAAAAGYAAGADVFVLGADEADRPGATVLTVLRRM